MPNKPTTFREEFEEEVWNIVKNDSLASSKIGTPSSNTRNKLKTFKEDFLTSHNEELIQKIEGLKKIKPYEKTRGSLYQPYQFVDCEYNQALDKVINLINQNK